MKVYISKYYSNDEEITFGVFSIWEKAYNHAMQFKEELTDYWWNVCIGVWEIDSDEYKVSMLIAKGKLNDDGDYTRWVNPEYSADVDPTENINQ